MSSRVISIHRRLRLLKMAAGLLLAAQLSGQASAQQLAFLTRGPYLQVRTDTSIVVRWRTDRPVDGLVRCGTDPANLNRLFTAPESTTEHQVTLTGLQPETKYYYAIGMTGAELGAFDERFVTGGSNNFFFTAPPSGTARPTRIWFVSDYGFANAGELAVRDSYFNFTAATRSADVWLTGGDNDQRMGADEQEQESIFETYASLLSHLPVCPTLGNHDTYTLSVPGPYPFFENFSFPMNGEAGGLASGSKHYYSFDYGDIHFVCMDSITPELSSHPDTPMLQWLRADLEQTAAKWKIAYWHGPPYTKGTHDSDSAWDISARMMQMRANALPILESHGVDLVLCGHSHVYERSCLLSGHYGYSWDLNPTNRVDGGNGREDGTGPYRQVMGSGTVYVVAAVGGSPVGFFYGRHPVHLMNFGAELGSCIIDVNENRLDFKFINANTNVLDYFTLIKEPPLRIAGVTRSSDKICLSWTSVPGTLYQIYGQSELGGEWTLAADHVKAEGTTTEWCAAWPVGAPTGYFLVCTSPP